ncbi:hypothetical protein JSY36_18980 [Bacillus sp. H-16]|nr:hypothetical protein [Alteribacter salitolerans]
MSFLKRKSTPEFNRDVHEHDILAMAYENWLEICSGGVICIFCYHSAPCGVDAALVWKCQTYETLEGQSEGPEKVKV